MTCVTAHQLIQEELDGLGHPPDLVAHLEACSTCRHYREGMRHLARDLEGQAQATRAPVALLRRLGFAPRAGGSRWMPIAAAAAMLLVYVGLQHAPSPPQPTNTPSMATELEDGEAILAWFGVEEAAF